MTDKWTRFDDALLPNLDARTEIGSTSRLHLIELPGGQVYNAHAGGRAPRAVESRAKRGWFVADTAEALEALYQALEAKSGLEGKLWRETITGASEWCWAALQEVRCTKEYWHRLALEVEVVLVRGSPWFAEAETGIETTGLADTGVGALLLLGVQGAGGGPRRLTVTNLGAVEATTPIITLGAGTGSITAWTLTNHTTGHVLAWSGTLNAGQVLEVHCGASSVKKDGVNAYDAGFIRPANKQNWFEIAPGSNSLTLAVTSTVPATGTFRIQFRATRR
jgi:hypothetical protein